VEIGSNVGVVTRAVGDDVLAKAVDPGVGIARRQFYGTAFHWVMVFLNAPDVVAKILHQPVLDGLATLPRLQVFVPNLTSRFCYVAAELAYAPNRLHLPLDEHCDELLIPVVPFKVRPEGLDHRLEHLRMCVHLSLR
jgi:hypothetical protein